MPSSIGPFARKTNNIRIMGRHPAGLRPRDERAHPVVKDAIDRGFVGTGQPYVIPGLRTRQAADEARRAVNNAARHLGVSCSSKASTDIIDSGNGTFELHFRLYTKASGRNHIAQSTGGDPSKLAYNTYRRAEPRILADDGTRMR